MHKYEDYRNIIVFIDSYENAVPSGRLSNAYYEQAQAFLGLTNFLLLVEHMLSTTHYPQAFDRRCHIGPPTTLLSETSNKFRASGGAVATFSVKILFRHNSSWQGSIRWIEGRSEKAFRSVLELVLFMDGALTKKSMEQSIIEKDSDEIQTAVN